MKLKLRKPIPLLLCAGVISFIALVQALTDGDEGWDFFRRLEWMSYDWRVRFAASQDSVNASNLGFVSINDESIADLKSRALGYQVGLYWPRFVYGHLVQELNTQGAEAIAFDVLFLEQRPDHKETPDSPGTPDEFFAASIALAGNVLIAADKGALPDPLFRTNVWAVGDVAAKRDSDGILRRTKAFEYYLTWHPLILRARQKFDDVRYDTNEIVFPLSNGRQARIPIDAEGKFDQSMLFDLAAEAEGRPRQFPTNVNRISTAYTRERVWDLGIALAAFHLKLNLDHPEVELGRRILLHGPGGLERSIPIDSEGRFYIDWSIPANASGLTHETFHSLLRRHKARSLGNGNDSINLWSNKLVVVGSTASGNDLTDFGATPLEKETYLTSRNWNIANSVLTGRFIRQTAPGFNFLLVLLMGLAAGLVTWKLRALPAALCVVLISGIYTFAALQCYLQARLWLPLIMPAACLVLTHFTLITHRAIFEQKEQRRIRNIFSKIVSPNVVHELLQAEKLSLGGARRQVTVFFADVRGFTEMTDDSEARAQEYVRQHKLNGREAEAYFDEQAQEVLQTVNLYLGIIADTIKKHEGTLDKYIGDCVMAFWGAPTPNGNHALSCVQAAIEAQRAIYALNQTRLIENRRREAENAERSKSSQLPRPLQRILSVGTGINTGTVTLGLMGSERPISNYTVFGREVNLAARLEGHSGRGRIFIGEATYLELLRDDATLAASCIEMGPVTFKGFRSAVKIYEVAWKSAEPAQASSGTETTIQTARTTAA